jgi:hypothetical protein
VSNNSIDTPRLDLFLDEGLVRQVEQHRMKLQSNERVKVPKDRGVGHIIRSCPAIELVLKDGREDGL